MASRRRWGRSVPLTATRASSTSIAFRHAPIVASTSSFTQVGDLERAVGALDQSLHARFHFSQLLSRRPQTRNSFLEERERLLEIDLSDRALTLASNAARFRATRELPRPRRSDYVTRAPTVRPRSSMLNGISARIGARTSARPSRTRDG